MRKAIAICALLIILGLMNWSIYAKEKHLAAGKIVYLELVPVDPRSLMQGDYMALRFDLENRINSERRNSASHNGEESKTESHDGHVIVTLDERNIGRFHALAESDNVANSQLRLRYRIRKGRVKFATNAFFFQEGHAKPYESARYGQFRVGKQGDLLLADLFDKDLMKIAP